MAYIKITDAAVKHGVHINSAYKWRLAGEIKYRWSAGNLLVDEDSFAARVAKRNLRLSKHPTQDVMQVILDAGEPLTPQEVSQRAGIKYHHAAAILMQLHRDYKIQRTGKGVKSAPFLYSI